MIHSLEQIDTGVLEGFDAVIDVRSPGEFAEDHVPGAVNMPVLDDAQRSEVGTIYVQDSPFRAGRIGAAYVARNIAAHLDGALSDRPKAFRPLIYCWRGGQRSNAMATVLAQVGWKTTVLRGGYKTWRSHVRTRLYDDAVGLDLILLDGDTGSGKTEILHRLRARGVQIIDLEGLAAHRGSLFGALPGQPQPGQKMFETRLLERIEALDPARPVVVEAEANKIGERLLPPSLAIAMAGAPRIFLQAPPAARAAYLARIYTDMASNPADLTTAIDRMSGYHGDKIIAGWRALAEANDHAALAAALIEQHYDPAYRRASRKHPRTELGCVELADLSAESQERAADAILALFHDRPTAEATAGKVQTATV